MNTLLDRFRRSAAGAVAAGRLSPAQVPKRTTPRFTVKSIVPVMVAGLVAVVSATASDAAGLAAETKRNTVPMILTVLNDNKRHDKDCELRLNVDQPSPSYSIASSFSILWRYNYNSEWATVVVTNSNNHAFGGAFDHERSHSGWGFVKRGCLVVEQGKVKLRDTSVPSYYRSPRPDGNLLHEPKNGVQMNIPSYVGKTVTHNGLKQRRVWQEAGVTKLIERYKKGKEKAYKAETDIILRDWPRMLQVGTLRKDQEFKVTYRARRKDGKPGVYVFGYVDVPKEAKRWGWVDAKYLDAIKLAALATTEPTEASSDITWFGEDDECLDDCPLELVEDLEDNSADQKPIGRPPEQGLPKRVQPQLGPNIFLNAERNLRYVVRNTYSQAYKCNMNFRYYESGLNIGDWGKGGVIPQTTPPTCDPVTAPPKTPPKAPAVTAPPKAPAVTAPPKAPAVTAPPKTPAVTAPPKPSPVQPQLGPNIFFNAERNLRYVVRNTYSQAYKRNMNFRYYESGLNIGDWGKGGVIPQ